MSELIQKNDNRATIRWKLLTGASALVLTAYVSSTVLAKAEDTEQPQVWIELGSQLSRLDGNQEAFAAPFEVGRPSIFSPSTKFDKPPLFSVDGFGKISFRPEGSSWTFDASIRIGRSIKDKHVREQTYPSARTFPSNFTGILERPVGALFADTKARNTEQHAILDFQAGKDVGLGLFGNKSGSAALSFGVRIAQFKSRSNSIHQSDPNWHFEGRQYAYNSAIYTYIVQPYSTNTASFHADRQFHGVGPSLAWNASLPFAGNSQEGELTFDWGLNAAILFGRQKTRTQHQTTARYHTGGTLFSAVFLYGHGATIVTANAPPASVRSRSVIVPNLGGSVGLSYRYGDAKLSFGYRYDAFLNAMDTGIDITKKSNVSFNGPYASISIGIGD